MQITFLFGKNFHPILLQRRSGQTAYLNFFSDCFDIFDTKVFYHFFHT